MAGITWSTLQTVLQSIIARTPAPYTAIDFAFQTLFPQATTYAENRIYREMPFLAQRLQDKSLTTTAGSRSISLHGTALPIVVPQRIALLVGPNSIGQTDGFGNPIVDGFGNPITTPDQAPFQIPFLPVSLDFIDMFWPQEALTWAPQNALAAYWCIEGGVSPEDFTSPDVIIAPTPDAAYTVVLTGLFQQAPISATTPQTYLSTNYPELMIAGCMLFLSGALLRNYSSAGGPASDEPAMAIHWSQQFDVLMAAAKEEEMRRLQQGTNWMNRPPMPAGAPPGAR
jgi:hypothetical protein